MTSSTARRTPRRPRGTGSSTRFRSRDRWSSTRRTGSRRIARTVAFVFQDRLAAVGARDALPAAQLHVRVAPGVGLQEPRDDEEEVEEAPFGQRRANRRPAFPFAERFVLDVGMGDVLAPGGRVGIERDDAVGGRAARLPPVQPDLETPQVDLVQLDRAGGHGDLARLGIELHLVELAVQGQEVAEDVGLAGQGRLEALLAQGGDQLGRAVLEALGLPEQLLGQTPRARRASLAVSARWICRASRRTCDQGRSSSGGGTSRETPLGDLLYCGVGHPQGGLVNRVHGIPRKKRGKQDTRGPSADEGCGRQAPRMDRRPVRDGAHR